MTSRLRLLSWNIHGFIGTDGKHSPDRIHQIIQGISPDIAAFQEVDCRGNGHTCQLTADGLRAAVGDHGHYAWSITSPDRRYGQVLASRFPIETGAIHDISIDGYEPRHVIEAEINAGAAGKLRVLATHLGLALHERRFQNSILRKLVARDTGLPLIVMGDFNNWLLERRSTGLAGVMSDRTGLRTFPSRFPLLPLDRIWTRPGGMLSMVQTHRSARQASDHLPLSAEIDFSKT